jgi:hypothetical protein
MSFSSAACRKKRAATAALGMARHAHENSLRIAGDGPLFEKLSREIGASSLAHIELVGQRTPMKFGR